MQNGNKNLKQILFLPLKGALSSSGEQTVYKRSDAFITDISVWHLLLVASKQTLTSASTENLVSEGIFLTRNLKYSYDTRDIKQIFKFISIKQTDIDIEKTLYNEKTNSSLGTTT